MLKQIAKCYQNAVEYQGKRLNRCCNKPNRCIFRWKHIKLANCHDNLLSSSIICNKIICTHNLMIMMYPNAIILYLLLLLRFCSSCLRQTKPPLPQYLWLPFVLKLQNTILWVHHLEWIIGSYLMGELKLISTQYLIHFLWMWMILCLQLNDIFDYIFS